MSTIDVSRRSFLIGSAALGTAAAVGAAGCSNGSSDGSASTASGDKATLVFTNAHVQTMVSEDDVAEAVAILDN